MTDKEKQSFFLKRTRELHHAHEQLLNKQCFKPRFMALSKEVRKDLTLDKFALQQPKEYRLTLPFSVEFLRVQANIAIGSKCLYCGQKITLKNFSLDHGIPVTRRAEPGLGEQLEYFTPSEIVNDWSHKPEIYSVDVGLLLAAFSWQNTVICCVQCNLRKGEMTAKDYGLLLQSLEQMSAKSASYVKRQLGLKAHWW